MAKFEQTLSGNFDEILQTIEEGILDADPPPWKNPATSAVAMRDAACGFSNDTAIWAAIA